MFPNLAAGSDATFPSLYVQSLPTCLLCSNSLALMTSIHDPDVLMKFCKKHVKLWEGEEINIQLACGHDLPVLRCHVYEFRPLDKELLRSHQYIPDSKTGQLIRVERWSPPLGIQQQNLKEESQYERYISGIVEHHLAAFSEMFFARDPNGFAARLFQLLMDFKPTDSGEVSCLLRSAI